MKLHIITIGKPKLTYAKLGWGEYLGRLQKLHTVRTTALSDKYANDASKILAVSGEAYIVATVIGGRQMTSEELAQVLQQKELEAKEIAWIIGGPDGLPPEVRKKADIEFGFSKLTFPHDLAMVILAETLYRSSTINAGTPYHH